MIVFVIISRLKFKKPKLEFEVNKLLLIRGCFYVFLDLIMCSAIF